jgi:glycerol-3-phosphate dehydrogenase
MNLSSFNNASRAALYKLLTSQPFELLVIDGGIAGASIFRDAALRGMRVAVGRHKYIQGRLN